MGFFYNVQIYEEMPTFNNPFFWYSFSILDEESPFEDITDISGICGKWETLAVGTISMPQSIVIQVHSHGVTFFNPENGFGEFILNPYMYFSSFLDFPIGETRTFNLTKMNLIFLVNNWIPRNGLVTFGVITQDCIVISLTTKELIVLNWQENVSTHR